MENKMFCFQCEQTAGCSGCTGKVGVCGKNADVAALQDKLTGELIGLVRATGDVVPTGNVLKLIIEGLFTTLTNVSFNEQTLNELIEKVRTERERLVPQCFACASPCGTNNEYDLSHIWTDNEDIRSLKSLILFGIRGMAAYAYHAMVLGYTNDEVSHFFVKALFALGEDWGMDKDTYSVTIPLGATINMDGAAITITVMTLAAANTLGIHVDFLSGIVLSILATLAACGASGVAGGSLLLIPMACSLFGISNDIAMQIVGVGFIIGVIQDSVETALNSSSDLLLSASAEFRQWRLEGKEIKY